MRVQVGDALQANLPGEHHGLVDVPDVLTPRRLKGTPSFRKSLTHLLEHRPEFRDLHPFRWQVGYRRPYPGDHILEVTVFWRQQ